MQAAAQDKKKIWAYLIDHAGVEYDCSSIFAILSSAADKGARLTIKVEGDDLTAEQLALRIYSALAGEDSFNLDFYRFEYGLKPKE